MKTTTCAWSRASAPCTSPSSTGRGPTHWKVWPRLQSRFASGPGGAARRSSPGLKPRLASNSRAAGRGSRGLEHGTLAIQGPPGTGKTSTGARMIVELARAGMRVGVTAVSHRVIRNLLDKALSAVAQEGVPLEAVHKVRKRSGETREGLHEEIGNAGGRQSLDAGRLLSGTAWLWARDDMVESVDHLFIDCLDGTTLERDIPVRGLAPATAAPPPAR